MGFLSDWPLWIQILFWILFWVELVGLVANIFILPLSAYRLSVVTGEGERAGIGTMLLCLLLAVIWPVVWGIILIGQEQKIKHSAHILGICFGLNASKRWFADSR